MIHTPHRFSLDSLCHAIQCGALFWLMAICHWHHRTPWPLSLKAHQRWCIQLFVGMMLAYLLIRHP